MAALPTPPHSLQQLESSLRDRLWRADMLVACKQSVPSGFAALDAQLPGGGWPTRCLSELLCNASGIGELRLIAPALSSLAKAGRQIVLLRPSDAHSPLIYPDGWRQLDIDPSSLLLVHASRAADRLWALEQVIKSASFGALLGWVDAIRPEALRRLQVAAASADGLSFLFRPESAQHHASAAPLRLLLGRKIIHNERRLTVRILKRRGPVLGAALELDVGLPRPLRTPIPARGTTQPMNEALQRHVMGRPVLPHLATRSHSAPIA